MGNQTLAPPIEIAFMSGYSNLYGFSLGVECLEEEGSSMYLPAGNSLAVRACTRKARNTRIAGFSRFLATGHEVWNQDILLVLFSSSLVVVACVAAAVALALALAGAGARSRERGAGAGSSEQYQYLWQYQ